MKRKHREQNQTFASSSRGALHLCSTCLTWALPAPSGGPETAEGQQRVRSRGWRGLAHCGSASAGARRNGAARGESGGKQRSALLSAREYLERSGSATITGIRQQSGKGGGAAREGKGRR
jgi:hypothetical protein